jgi:hypothetical protein
VLTAAEQLHQQGWAEGYAEGRFLAARETLLGLCVLKYGPIDASHNQQIVGATLDRLRTWTIRVLTASSLGEVFEE